MWWFYTVVLGVSFGQILQELALGVREWSRGRGRPFPPAMLWQVFLLVLVVQVWLAVTYYRETVTRVSIAELVAFLVVPAAILVMSFLLPESGADDGADPETAFARVRPVFFGVLIGMVTVNLLHGFLVGEQGLDADLLFQSLLVAGGLIGLAIRNRTADTVLAGALTTVLAVYIGVEYATVPATD